MNFKFGGLCCLVPLFDFVTFSLTKIPPCVFTIFLKLSLDAAIKKGISTWPIFTKFSSNQIVLTEKTNIWLCDIFFPVLTKFVEFWPWVTKKAYAQGKKNLVKLWWCHIFKFVLALYSSSPSDLQLNFCLSGSFYYCTATVELTCNTPRLLHPG